MSKVVYFTERTYLMLYESPGLVHTANKFVILKQFCQI